MKKLFLLITIFLIVITVLFRLLCGVFVIQPIGAVPDGATIIYWKYKVEMDLPFIASADGLLNDSGAGVSLLGRGVILAKVSKPILENEIFRMDYSKNLYLWSTDGKEYTK